MTTNGSTNPIGSLLAPFVNIESQFDPFFEPFFTPLGTDPTTGEPLVRPEGPLTAINALGAGQTPQFVNFIQNIPTILSNLPGLPAPPGGDGGTVAARNRQLAAARARQRTTGATGITNRIDARRQAQRAQERRVAGYNGNGGGVTRGGTRPTLG